MTRPSVAVAAGVLVRSDGAVLLGQRPPSKVYAGYWEFPGGKIEQGETAQQALARELREELGIGVTRADPWFCRRFEYPHAAVHIRFFRVTAWSGEPHAVEHTGLAWQKPGTFSVAPMLPANSPILRALGMPGEYAVSDAAGMGRAAFLAALEHRLSRGLRLLQLREKSMPEEEFRTLAGAVRERCRAHGALLLVNGEPALAQSVGADGVHLPAVLLRALKLRPALEWVGASCHDAGELARAAELGLDFAVLGPVLPTASHPGGGPVLGWGGLADLLREVEIPVYAIGGLRAGDIDRARACGAQGIAMIRGAWGG